MYKLKMTWMYLGFLLAGISLLVLQYATLTPTVKIFFQVMFGLGLAIAVVGLFKH
jgi:hypothetical protein